MGGAEGSAGVSENWSDLGQLLEGVHEDSSIVAKAEGGQASVRRVKAEDGEARDRSVEERCITYRCVRLDRRTHLSRRTYEKYPSYPRRYGRRNVGNA